MENETEAVSDVLVLLHLSPRPPRGYHPLLFPGCLSFSDIIAFLSAFVPFSLPLSLSHTHKHTLTYKQRELSLAYRDPLLL